MGAGVTLYERAGIYISPANRRMLSTVIGLCLLLSLAIFGRVVVRAVNSNDGPTPKTNPTRVAVRLTLGTKSKFHAKPMTE